MEETRFLEINDVTRMIAVPSDLLLGVRGDKDVERVYFRCPKIVGDNINLAEHQIYVKYVAAPDRSGERYDKKEPGIYHCQDVINEGEHITFSWKLSGNVFEKKGFVAFSILATDGEATRWNTFPAIGTVLITIPGGLEEVAEQYPDIITQLLNRMDEVEAIATPEAMQEYVNTYLAAHPAELDPSLTDNTKAAPANLVGEIKGDLVDHIKESQKAIEDLNDKKITKFYANNLGETKLSDSDKGKIQDMMLYGKSLQDGTPTPDNPIEIQSVINPKIEVCGKNLLNLQSSIYSNDVSCENNTIKNIATDSNDTFSANFKLGHYDGTSVYEKVITSNGKYICNFTLKEKTSVHFKHNGSSLDVRILSILLEKGSYTFSFNVDGNCPSKAGGLIINDIQIELGSTATDYEPYKEQTVALPYTLNAIPVSSGGNVTIDGQQYIADYVDVERGKLVRIVDSSKLDNTQSIIDKTEWLLAEQQETDLTTEQTQALKELATYYSVTNISVNSEQLDGYTIFNYPISMANGWNYVKQQLNDNRDYIYDMDTRTQDMDIQAAEAYVNSEYAVTLAELEV